MPRCGHFLGTGLPEVLVHRTDVDRSAARLPALALSPQHAAAFLVLGLVDFAARKAFLQDLLRAVAGRAAARAGHHEEHQEDASGDKQNYKNRAEMHPGPEPIAVPPPHGTLHS